MKKYVHQLSRKFNSKNAAIIDKNVLNPDSLSLSIFIYNEEEIQSLKRLLKITKVTSDYQPESSFSNVSVHTTLNDFIASQNENLDEKLVSELNSVLDNAQFDCNNKSILSVLWAKVISNTLNKNTKNNEALIDAFYAIIEASDKDGTVDELHDEVFEIFKDKEVISNYFAHTYNDVRNANFWLDFTSYPPTFVDDEMVYDLAIKSNEELVEALKDFKNLPSALEYIKNNFLNESDVRSEGYCKDELIRDYKALAVALRIVSDERYNIDNDFDENNNIGLNLSAKLFATEELIKKEHINYKNTEVFAGFKQQSRKIAIRALGNDSTNVYGVWRNVLNSYIKQCTSIARKVKSGEISVTTRNYLKTLGIVQDRQVINDFNKILADLKNKTDDARKVITYLTEKKIGQLSSDPFIDDAEELLKEFTSWATATKNDFARPLKLAHVQTDTLTPRLKEYAVVAKRQAKLKLKPSAKTKAQENQPVQMSLYDNVQPENE